MKEKEELIRAYIEGDNGRPNEDIEEDLEKDFPVSIPAGVIGAPYYFYRKCYGRGLLIAMLDILILVSAMISYSVIASVRLGNGIEGFAGIIKSDLTDLPLYIRTYLSVIAAFIIFIRSILFYGGYKKKLKAAIGSSKGNIEIIKESGGVDRVMPLIGFIGEAMVLLILVATVIHFG